MTETAKFVAARQAFHANLRDSILTTSALGVVSIADTGNAASKEIAKGIAGLLACYKVEKRSAPQTSGDLFEEFCASFLKDTFGQLEHLRPGNWDIHKVNTRSRLEIAKYGQYAHLVALDDASRANRQLAAIIGTDYLITPDIVVIRQAEDDDSINQRSVLVDDTVTTHASLRKQFGGLPFLHASISCKWTLRSDRAQNARSEALNLIRNRKGRLPHIAVITAEPLPSRLASLALGTGDIDGVYHFALYELEKTVKALKLDDSVELLKIMVDGGRLKDISDLPLDLAV